MRQPIRIASSSNIDRKRRAAAIGDKKSEQDEPEVAVDRTRTGRVFERHRADVVLELAPAGSAARRAGAPAGRTRARADRATVTASRSASAPVGERVRDGSSSCSAPRPTSPSPPCRRDRLCQRREIERRVAGRSALPALERQSCRRRRPERLGARSDLDRGGRKHAAAKLPARGRGARRSTFTFLEARRQRFAARQPARPTPTQMAVPVKHVPCPRERRKQLHGDHRHERHPMPAIAPVSVARSLSARRAETRRASAHTQSTRSSGRP